MNPAPIRRRGRVALIILASLAVIAGITALVWALLPSRSPHPQPATESKRSTPLKYERRHGPDAAGFFPVLELIEPWAADATLAEVARAWDRVGYRNIELIDRRLANESLSDSQRFDLQLTKSSLYNYEGDPVRAYQVLEQVRAEIETNDAAAEERLMTVIFLQGVTALRRGENENCIMCRGESSCILPISPAAVHTNPEGSRLAIRHFSEYLRQFPDDLEVHWLLNLAHMTLGEHPDGVDPAFLIDLRHYRNSEFDIGRFRDIGHLVKVNRFNQGGGGLMEDMDNDGRLDIVATTWDATAPMVYYHNDGKGAFENHTAPAGLEGQLGGVYCTPADFNNDGFMDIFIARGAWLPYPIRPSLLQNNGDGTFADVTPEAGLLESANSISATWADYDNDGSIDLFFCCESSPCRLFHSRSDGTFEEVASAAGLRENGFRPCKGAAWIDFDNDGFQDLLVDYMIPAPGGQLFHNRRNGAFADVTSAMGLDGPVMGFSCWAWDYDNDGWLDLFATSYERTLKDVVKGLMGRPHHCASNKLYHNLEGRRFEDKTLDAGLDMVFSTMGSNFADFDNDGFLDFYLGTGDPNFTMLIPNRMFKNVAGRRFAEISCSSGTGHLQKGHSVACGDWDRDGNIDLFIEMGGAVNGDKYHNILFQNPGHPNHWLTLRLVGQQTNRAAIGARIKVVTAGPEPLTVYRHVSSGSSFGANPLLQTIGLGRAERIASLEVHWPASGTTRVFRDLAVDQALEIAEFADDYRPLDWEPIPVAK